MGCEVLEVGRPLNLVCMGLPDSAQESPLLQPPERLPGPLRSPVLALLAQPHWALGPSPPHSPATGGRPSSSRPRRRAAARGPRRQAGMVLCRAGGVQV